MPKRSLAECERPLSAYNRLKTDLRSTIDVETQTTIMYVDLLYNMLPLVKYELRPAVLYWGPIFEKSYDDFTIVNSS